ncbi:hypothetical protein Y032_0020g1 [Ancylostoma ceylanicum]|nr:hypothetical protein Y032_0020g1 [Ancylostoma ceylanicum]
MVKSELIMKLLLAALLLLIVDAHVENSSLLANRTYAGDPLIRTHVDKKAHKFPFALLATVADLIFSGVTAVSNAIRGVKDVKETVS